MPTANAEGKAASSAWRRLDSDASFGSFSDRQQHLRAQSSQTQRLTTACSSAGSLWATRAKNKARQRLLKAKLVVVMQPGAGISNIAVNSSTVGSVPQAVRALAIGMVQTFLKKNKALGPIGCCPCRRAPVAESQKRKKKPFVAEGLRTRRGGSSKKKVVAGDERGRSAER